VAPSAHGKRGKSHILYAKAPDGRSLPIVDITDPFFVSHTTDEELEAIIADSVRKLKASSTQPRFIRRWIVSHSILLHALMLSGKPFLGGIGTYLFKLSPACFGRGLGGFLDRKVSQAIGPLTIRLRFQAYVHLLAEELAPTLDEDLNRPLWLLSIAGGTAAESWNTLLVLQKEKPELVAVRPIGVNVLDLESEGPMFGEQVFRVLGEEGGPLHGLNLDFSDTPYDWTDVTPLQELLLKRKEEKPVVAVSSEGGLFEYGSDEEIINHLEVLQEEAPRDTVVFGTAVKDALAVRTVHTTSSFTFLTRTEDEVAQLAAKAGWRISRTVPGNPHYHIFSLRRH